MSSTTPSETHTLIRRIEEELHAQASLGLLSNGKEALGEKWTGLVAREPRRFIRDDLSLDAEAVRNFRRRQIFVSDYGNLNLSRWLPQMWLLGSRRGARRRLIECLETLKALGETELLQKYPCHPTGNPYIFTREGYRYTYRWHKHIHFLALFNRVLRPRLADSFVTVDIGSSYGIFSSLVKRECPQSHHVLIDFPEQLLLAYYFLETCFPDARIAGVRELSELPQITREVVESYDFVLVPGTWYERLAPGTADVITNFASLGEMPRRWFTYYLDSPAFTSSKYFFTANRIQSAPTFDTDVTILDYPIWSPAKRLHFGICPVFSHTYVRKRLLFYERLTYSSPYFEYLGAI